MKLNYRSGRWQSATILAGTAVAILAFCSGAALAQQRELPLTTLSAGIYLIQAEVAGTPMTRSIGLMRRKSMAQGAGMLFVFDETAVQCMWMKNTLIPLSVAFLDESGRIVNIADMEPLNETSHCASRPVRFALEMNQGWFKKRGIVPGEVVQGLGKYSAAAR